MSKISELYELNFREENITPPIEKLDESKLSEKEKCKLLGIPCSFGICSECNIADWD